MFCMFCSRLWCICQKPTQMPSTCVPDGATMNIPSGMSDQLLCQLFLQQLLWLNWIRHCSLLFA